MKKLFVLFTAVLLLAVFVVPVSAAEPKMFSYNGVVLPEVPTEFQRNFIYLNSLDEYCFATLEGDYVVDPFGSASFHAVNIRIYNYQSGSWVLTSEALDSLSMYALADFATIHDDFIWSDFSTDDGWFTASSPVLVEVPPASPSPVDQYYFNDYVLPALPTPCGDFNFIYLGTNGIIYLLSGALLDGVISLRNVNQLVFDYVDHYKLVDGEWLLALSFDDLSSYTVSDIGSAIWSSADIDSGVVDGGIWFYGSLPVLALCDGSSCPSTDVDKDNICDDCGLKFAELRDYGPFTVKEFMNNVGQIFSSAARWVGNVGAAILAQPLLLAFTALPLCGLGIAVFRRLKNTV